jgi:hypothetical protein
VSAMIAGEEEMDRCAGEVIARVGDQLALIKNNEKFRYARRQKRGGSSGGAVLLNEKLRWWG